MMDVSIYLNPVKKSTNFAEGTIGQNIIEYNEDSFPEINKSYCFNFNPRKQREQGKRE